MSVLDNLFSSPREREAPGQYKGQLQSYDDILKSVQGLQDTEGEDIEPAFSVAQKHLSERPSQAPSAEGAQAASAPSSAAAPAAGKPAGPRQPKVGDIAVNKKTGERRKLNAQGQWAKINSMDKAVKFNHNISWINRFIA